MKRLLVSVLILIPVILLASFLFIDLNKAKAGKSSRVFTSKSEYKYPETLRFNDFKVSLIDVDKLPEAPDERLAKTDCYNLPVRDQPDVFDDATSDFEKSLLYSKYKYTYLTECLNAKAQDETPTVIVEFKVKNASSSVQTLDPYKFSIIGDSSIKERWRDINSGVMTQNEDREFRVGFKYNRHFNGSFRLLVENNGVNKSLEFTYPLESSN